MRVMKLTLVGALIVLIMVAGLGTVASARVVNLWQLGHVDEFVARLATVVHAGQARRASPHESVSETIDGSEITITYGRPYMRGRTIFGRLVPWDRVWCPGADEATTLKSARELRLGQLAVPPGPHTIWVRPTPNAWSLIVSKEPSGFHTNYNPSADLGSVDMIKRTVSPPVEQLTFAIVKNPAGRGGAITLTWETTEVSVPFTVQ